MADSRAQRLARNETMFRELNGTQPLGWEGERKFFCECADIACTEKTLLTHADYLRAHEDQRCFTVIPDHDDPTVETVIARDDRFWVVQKLPLAGVQEIVEE